MVWQHNSFYYQSKSTYYKAQFYKGISLIIIISFFYIVQIANINFLPSWLHGGHKSSRSYTWEKEYYRVIQ